MKVRAVLFESSSSYFRHWLRLVPPAIVLSACAELPALLSDTWGQLVALPMALSVVWLLQAIHTIDSAETRLGHANAGLPEDLRHLRARLKTLLAAFGLMIVVLVLLFATWEALSEDVLDWNTPAGISGVIAVALLFVFLVARWSLVVPVILIEDVRARTAFRRSQQLARGHSVPIFGVLFVAWLVSLVWFLLIEAVATGLVGGGHLHDFVRGGMAPFADAFVAILWTNAYFALRREGENWLKMLPPQ